MHDGEIWPIIVKPEARIDITVVMCVFSLKERKPRDQIC